MCDRDTQGMYWGLWVTDTFFVRPLLEILFRVQEMLGVYLPCVPEPQRVKG